MEKEQHEYESFMTAQQAADFMGVAVGTIRFWVWNRYIPYYKAGRRLRFRASELVSWMKERAAK